MENALSIAKVLGPMFLVMGLSVLLYAKVWQRVLEKWEHDHLALFPLMFVYMVLGVLMVNMYNVWTWNIWLIVTISGWAMVVKSVFYLLLPGSLITKALALKKSMGMIYLGGVIATAAGLALCYYTYFALVY